MLAGRMDGPFRATVELEHGKERWIRCGKRTRDELRC